MSSFTQRMIAKTSNQTPSNTTADDNSSSSSSSLTIILSPQTRFWIFLAFEIPAVFCSIFLLHGLCFNQTQRKALNNHVIIVILILSFLMLIIDFPNYLSVLYSGSVLIKSPVNCSIWLFVDIACFYGIGIFMAWASIERHILVFHNQWLISRKQRILVHYLPIVAILLYLCIFYTVLIFFAPCKNAFYYDQFVCSGACAYQFGTVGMTDGFLNGVVPCLLITIFNILLLCRVIKQKQHLRQRVDWRKYRRMIIQMGSCTALFLLFDIPLMGLYMAQAVGLSYGATGQFEMFVYFLSYFIILWMPFVCLVSSPEICKKLKKVFPSQHFNNTITAQRMT